MDGEVVVVLISIAAQGATIWYKLGKLEGKVEQLCQRVRRLESNLNQKG